MGFLQAAVVLAEGRSGNPSLVGGIAIVLGVAIAVLVVAALVHWLPTRRARSAPDSHRHRPHPRGEVGRVGKERGP